jgi:hypothetical protein
VDGGVAAAGAGERFHAAIRFVHAPVGLSGPANLIDKLRDARGDFRRGEIIVKPTLRFRARLAGEIIRRTARLALRSPGNWRLASWGVQSLFAETIGFRSDIPHSTN